MVIKRYYDLYNPLCSLLVYHMTVYVGEGLENYDGNQVAVWIIWVLDLILRFFL
jgi:hypothetical protein